MANSITTSDTPTRRRIRSFDFFRGFTIITVVCVHCRTLSNWHTNTFWEKFLTNLFFGGTVLFVFISGFMFHRIFYKSFDYKIFIKKKIRNVLLPYLALSFIAITYFLLIKNQGLHLNYEIDNPLLGYLFYFLTGKIFSAYWYIPLILVIFFLSPLFIKLIDIRLSIGVILFLFILPLFAQRPNDNFNLLQSFVYFAPIYILGSWVSLNCQRVYQLLQGKEFLLFAIVLILAYAQVIYYPYSGNAHKNAFELALIDINLIQKIVLCFLLFIFFHRYENRKFHILVFLANASFPIYFIHPFVIILLDKLKKVTHSEFDGSFLTFTLTTSLVIILSAWIALIGRKIIGQRYSRSLIGW